MKILIDASGIVNYTTGVGQYSYHLLHELSEIDRVNEYFILISNDLSKKHPIFELEQNNNVQFIFVNLPAIGIRRQYEYFKIKGKLHYDIFHCLNSNYPYCMNKSGVCTIHDLTYMKYADYFHKFKRVKKFYLKTVHNYALKVCHKIICDSYSTQKDLLETFGTKYETKMKVIHLAASMPETDMNIDLKTHFGIEKPYFLFTGMKRPHKNVEGLLKAFSFFCKTYKNSSEFKLVITGGKYYDYDNYMKQIDREIEKRVILTGFISDEILPQVYKESFAFLFVSFYEGFGIPILEAMHCKIPVITSNISSMPEILGGAGLIVNPYDYKDIALKMNLLVENDALRNELILKGKKRVQEFSWEKTAGQTLEVYKSIYYQ